MNAKLWANIEEPRKVTEPCGGGGGVRCGAGDRPLQVEQKCFVKIFSIIYSLLKNSVHLLLLFDIRSK